MATANWLFRGGRIVFAGNNVNTDSDDSAILVFTIVVQWKY